MYYDYRFIDFMSFLPGKIPLKTYLKSFKNLDVAQKDIFPHSCVLNYGIFVKIFVTIFFQTFLNIFF